MPKPFWIKLMFAEIATELTRIKNLDDPAMRAEIERSLDDVITLNTKGKSFGSRIVKKAVAVMESRSSTYRTNAYARWHKEGTEIASGYLPSGGGARRAPETMGADPEAHAVESASGSSGILQGQEQRPSDADGGMDCETPASENFDAAAGPDGGGECSPRAQSPAAPRRPSPAAAEAANGGKPRHQRRDCSRPSDIGEVYDFAQRHGITDSTAHAFWDWNESREWCDPETGEALHNWKGALRNFAKGDRN
jgi:hypothetical protein